MLFLLFESNHGHLKPMWPRCFQVDKIIEAARKSSEVGFVTCAPGFWEICHEVRCERELT